MSIANQDNWVMRLQSGPPEQEEAIAELRELLLRGLSRSLNTRYGSPFQAEDIVQDALIKILNSLDTFQGRSRFTTWAMTIATRVGISELRRKHTKNVSLDGITAADGLRFELAVDGQKSVDDQMSKTAILKKLQELIEADLSDRQKLAMRGLLEGIPVDELARRVGSNRNAVYKLIHDARQKLRRSFEQAGISADDIHAAIA